MAEIGVERLAAGDRQEHRAERHQADGAVGQQEVHAHTTGLIAASTVGSSLMWIRPITAMRAEPDDHDRAEGAATRAVPLLCTANSTTRITIVSGTT